MARAAAQMRQAAKEAEHAHHTLTDLLASETARRKRMLWDLRTQKAYMFGMAVIGGFVGVELNFLAGRLTTRIMGLF